MVSRKLACMAAAAFVSSMLVLSATANADPPRPVVVQGRADIDQDTRRIVHYGDLDLANSAGREVLIRRVGFAVREVCDGQLYASTDFSMSGETRKCAKVAWQSANPQITTALQLAQSGTFVAAGAAIITVRSN